MCVKAKMVSVDFHVDLLQSSIKRTLPRLSDGKVKAEALAFISSTATDPDEILEKQERFDKEVEFGLTSMQALIGYTW